MGGQGVTAQGSKEHQGHKEVFVAGECAKNRNMRCLLVPRISFHTSHMCQELVHSLHELHTWMCQLDAKLLT